MVLHSFAFLLTSEHRGHSLSGTSIYTTGAIIVTHTKQVGKTIVVSLRLFESAVVVGNFAKASHHQSIRGDIATVRVHLRTRADIISSSRGGLKRDGGIVKRATSVSEPSRCFRRRRRRLYRSRKGYSLRFFSLALSRRPVWIRPG